MLLCFCGVSHAVERGAWRGEVPEWIAYYEEGDVFCECVGEDGVGGGFDHFAVGENYWTAIEEFLL